VPALIPAYDVESEGRCLAACRSIAGVHRELAAPATFFIVGRLLEEEGGAYRELLDEPGLFEVASHSYSHEMILDHPVCGPAAAPEEVRREITLGKERVEQTFERECLGFRPGCCFERGLRGASEALETVVSAGYRYVSSQAWGPCFTLPAPLCQAYTYAEDGYPALWEFPGHGWHENVLKGFNATPGRLLLWPPLYPGHHPEGLVRTPEEEFEVHRFFMDRAIEEDLEYVSLIWHPWSLARFDPEMRMLRLALDYATGQGMELLRFQDLLGRKAAQGIVGRPSQ